MFTNEEWNAVKYLLNLTVLLFQYALLPIAIYHFVISVFGWIKRKEEPAEKYPPAHRFALVVAAHNEQRVVGNIVRNLKKLRYPRELYDIFVIADNCSDHTADVARNNGALVFERFDNEKKGKGFALRWMFDILFKMKKKYDAVCVFDADNLVSPNFLLEMNKHLSKGHKVVQGYLDSKNPHDTWISGNYSISYWISNRVFQLPRHYLGLSCALGGTGFMMATDILEELGWNATCLTEDLEFSLQLVLKNRKVYWAHEAVVYDEKPQTLSQSWRQRKRWMQGQADCMVRYTKKLLSKAIKERDLVSLDCAIYVVQPAIVVLSGVLLVMNILKALFFTDYSVAGAGGAIAGLVLPAVFSYAFFIFVIVEGKFSMKIAAYCLLMPVYALTWIPIIIQGYRDRKRTEWAHTIHTRAIDIQEIKRLGNVS